MSAAAVVKYFMLTGWDRRRAGKNEAGCWNRRKKVGNEGNEESLGLYTISDVSRFQCPPPRSTKPLSFSPYLKTDARP